MRALVSIAFVVSGACSSTFGPAPGESDARRSTDADPRAPDADPRAPDADPRAPDAKPTATPDAPAGVGEPPELVGITLAHNEARSKVGVSPLVWDPQLAAIASAWVVQCIDTDGNGLVDHNANRSMGYSTYVGENIYASSGTATGPAAVALWVAEAASYDYATNTCAAGKTCGHYTQVVWAATTKLGCALHACAGLTYPSTIVCDYGPGGNDGGRPY